MLQFHFFSLLLDAMNSLQKIGKIDFNDSCLAQNFVFIRRINKLPEVTLQIVLQLVFTFDILEPLQPFINEFFSYVSYNIFNSWSLNKLLFLKIVDDYAVFRRRTTTKREAEFVRIFDFFANE